MRYWLMKSEPGEFSIDDLVHAPDQTTWWFGVRNYQARNFMRDDMHVGDLAFFYHSSCPQPGIAGIVEIRHAAAPDETQFDPESDYYDPKASRELPRWLNVAVTLKEKTRLLPLAELRAHSELASMTLLKRGNRLSITPVTKKEWHTIRALLQMPASASRKTRLQ